MASTSQQIKSAAIAKAKSAVSSATTTNGNGNGNGSNGSASKKRRGNNQLKPIITNEGPQNAETASSMASNSNAAK